MEFANELIIVDLGCGDFTIGEKLLQSLNGVGYIGCDIVPELIAFNQKHFLINKIKFQTLDIVRDVLPKGHVCLIRQVFQHLSNAEISTVLSKLTRYKYVYVTEGQPITREGLPNPDKRAGADVRFDWRTGRGRGVELDQPPWNLELVEIARSQSTGFVNEALVTHRILHLAPNPAACPFDGRPRLDGNLPS
jgi:hypothetical protein